MPRHSDIQAGAEPEVPDAPQRVARAVRALRERNPRLAADLLLPVAHSRALANAPDLVDVRAKVCSLLAQALLACDRPDAALTWVSTAQDLADTAHDAHARDTLTALRTQIEEGVAAATRTKASQRRRAHVASVPLEQLLGPVTDASRRRAVMVEKGLADADAGRPEDARRVLTAAKALADDASDCREQVLARIGLSRITSAPAPLLVDAVRVARDAGEPQLVGVVAREAELRGVDLGTQRGPILPSPTPES